MAVPYDRYVAPDWVKYGRGGPFDLDAEAAYRRWRERKLEAVPQRPDELVVEVRDPRELAPRERARLLELCARYNMALYRSGTGGRPDKSITLLLGTQLGLGRPDLDRNPCSDPDGVTPLAVARSGPRAGFVPYTERAIDWHTDGYYNTRSRQIHGLILHCVRPAEAGGENGMLDHEIAYILLRDEDPALVEALMHPQAMTIPAHVREGRVLRPARTGPVFSVTREGRLHMRYTRRARNVTWRDDPVLRRALARLEALLEDDATPGLVRRRLGPGEGLVCNNVLHMRTAFEDPHDGRPGRLLYRARYCLPVGGL